MVGVGVLVLQHLVAEGAGEAGRLAMHCLHVATRVALARELLQAKTTAPRGSSLIGGFQVLLNQACTHAHNIQNECVLLTL